MALLTHGGGVGEPAGSGDTGSHTPSTRLGLAVSAPTCQARLVASSFIFVFSFLFNISLSLRWGDKPSLFAHDCPGFSTEAPEFGAHSEARTNREGWSP